MIEVAIIGAGPYGLSIAAHLKRCEVPFRIFGSPMHTWLTSMPRGMRLKSEGFASSLYDPDSALTLESFCGQRGLKYAALGVPVPLETFTVYGLEFQKKFVPELEGKMIASLHRSPSGFQIGLEDGEIVVARRVVIAVGLCYFAYVPSILSDLTEEFVTHSSKHCTVDRFKGREVAIVGAGASALDLAALLHQAGAFVQLVARQPIVRFHHQGRVPRPLLEQMRHPTTGLGPGWRSLFYSSAPQVFRHMPAALRLKIVRRHLGPAPAWFVKDEVVGKVPFNLGMTITRANVRDGRISLDLCNRNRAPRTLVADHVIAATGYRVDIRRLHFLSSDVLLGIQTVERAPALSADFESSVPGLYFVGTAAANTFGPLMRFAFGARFTAERLSRHFAKASRS
ncbi:MAG TPA: NAD(P)-binding domain-containing protein [Terriglobales bacterium]|nr:NAD(P)-binding domain-containing protein [Terriglobales bacterium]